MKARPAKPATVILVWSAILGIGMVSAEAYARHVQHYLLAGWTLRRTNFFELDRLKIWNRRFYNQHRAYFAGWPIPLEFFDAERPTPRYLFKPNLRMTLRHSRLVPARTGDKIYWSSNTWGFRGSDFDLPKPDHLIRIVCLGASTTEGSQSDQETYPFYLERQLQRMFPALRIEVINAGHHGQGVDDLLEILKSRVLPLHPDAVIWYEGANDVNLRDFVEGLGCRLGWPSGTCWLASYPTWHRYLYEHTAVFVMLSNALGWNQSPPHADTS